MNWAVIVLSGIAAGYAVARLGNYLDVVRDRIIIARHVRRRP